MKHPLVQKYNKSALQGLSSEELKAVRDEIRAAIEGTGKAKLAQEDRVVLMQLWIATCDERAGEKIAARPDTSSAPIPPKKQRKLSMRRPDFTRLRGILSKFRLLKAGDIAFIILILGVSAGVITLGAHALQETIKIEAVKREAESLEEWMRTNGPRRADTGFEPAACQKKASGLLGDCLTSIAGDRKNHFKDDKPLFAAKCDIANSDSLGAIILERIRTSASGAIISSPLDGSDEIGQDFTIRIVVCTRGFHAIRVANDFLF
jgi:hypothetical protein